MSDFDSFVDDTLDSLISRYTVKPKTGTAVYFSYIDPKTNLTDNGLTEHSGCPVYEGEKKIVTQWIRYVRCSSDALVAHLVPDALHKKTQQVCVPFLSI